MSAKFFSKAIAAALTTLASLPGFATSVTVTSVTNLHPAGALFSRGIGVSGGQQVGMIHDGVTHRASLWTSSAGSRVSLDPLGSYWSECFGTDGIQQVGFAHINTNPFGYRTASLWSGTAASWINLGPAGSTNSTAYSVLNGVQVGYANVGGADRASLWTGTAASWANLHPVGTFDSVLYGLDSGNQVGYVRIAGVFRASRWAGTAASWIDLHPAGSNESVAYGVGDNQQVGYARVGGVFHASLWTGTAGSWVDLNPAGSTESIAYDTISGWQVGYARFGSSFHAGLWNGSASTWIDLHSTLGPGYSGSSARKVWRSGTTLYIVGSAQNSVFGRSEAHLWTVQVGAPPVAVEDFYGVVQGNALAEAGPGVLVNDSDPNLEDTLTVSLVDAPSHATSFQLNSDGSFNYVPLPYFFGTDTFTYRANDGIADSNLATVTITVAQPGAEGFVTGGGKFFQDGVKCTFGFNAKSRGGPKGSLEFQNHETGIDVKSTSVDWVYVANATDGFFSGTCKVNGDSGYTFFVQVHDRGEPGQDDDFSIWVLNSFGIPVHTWTGQLTGGNIQIHL